MIAIKKKLSLKDSSQLPAAQGLPLLVHLAALKNILHLLQAFECVCRGEFGVFQGEGSWKGQFWEVFFPFSVQFAGPVYDLMKKAH